MYLTFLQGFALSITLILAIGAQNAFVLCQGLRGAHIFWVCLVCGVIDAVLILAGITGFGALAQSLPWFETAMRYGGAAFYYGMVGRMWSLRGEAVAPLKQPMGRKIAAKHTGYIGCPVFAEPACLLGYSCVDRLDLSPV